MSKKYLIISVALLVLILAGGSYYWKTKPQKSAGVLPVIDTSVANPTESVQATNPYDKTNPFSNIKVNPFE